MDRFDAGVSFSVLGRIAGWIYIRDDQLGDEYRIHADRLAQRWNTHADRWEPIGHAEKVDLIRAIGETVELAEDLGSPTQEYRLDAYSGHKSMTVDLTPAAAEQTNRTLEERGINCRWRPTHPNYLPTMSTPNWPERIRTLRAKFRWSQTDLAAFLGVTQRQSVARWESGKHTPSPRVRQRVEHLEELAEQLPDPIDL